MRLEEFDQFKAELKQLCATLGKAYTDSLAQAYWRALRDATLAEVQLHVERILLSAGKETKFPKPFELRTVPSPRAEGLPENALKLNEAVWREKFAQNPQTAEREQCWCQLQRILASTALDSPQYAEALSQSRAFEKRYGEPRFWALEESASLGLQVPLV